MNSFIRQGSWRKVLDGSDIVALPTIHALARDVTWSVFGTERRGVQGVAIDCHAPAC